MADEAPDVILLPVPLFHVSGCNGILLPRYRALCSNTIQSAIDLLLMDGPVSSRGAPS